MSGADIPVELKNYGITACIIFQRGPYPSMGTSPEVKYYFLGISSGGNFGSYCSYGAVVDDKVGGLGIYPMIDLPARFHNVTGGVIRGNAAQIHNMDVTIGEGSHKTQGAIRADVSPGHAGQVVTAQNWYNVSLNSGWSALAGSGFPNGVEFRPLATGSIQIRGALNCTLASSANTVICNIGTNDFFKTFPSRIHAFIGVWDTPGSGICQMTVEQTGDVRIGGILNAPPNGSHLVFETTYSGEQ